MNIFYSNAINGNTKEISSFLKKDIKKMNCFKISFTNGNEDGYISTANFNNDEIELMFLVTYFPDKNYFKRCLSINDSNEGFYSFQYIKKNNEKSLNIYPPQLLGIEYSRYFVEGDTIQLIPIKTENEYEYITYNIKLEQGYKINAYINSCETYPLCDAETMINNSKKIEIFNSFSISFSKKEIDEFSSSTIDKNQKILLITCVTGTHSYPTSRSDEKYKYCLVKINMYTNNNTIHLEPYISNYRYIANNDETNFEIGSGNNNIEYMILNMELLSGNISFIASDKKNIEYYLNNKKLLAIIKKKEFKFKIKSSENSYYHLNYILKNNIYIDFSYTIGANYLFNLKELSKNIIFSNPRINYDYEYKVKPAFISFSPNNCNIKVIQTIDLYEESKEELEKLKDFYQDITYKNEKNVSIFSSFNIFNYTITKDKNKGQNCFVDVAFYEYSLDYSNAIVLTSNSPKIFYFKNSLIFSYPVTNKDNDILIDFQLLDETKYNINIIINDEKYYNNYILEKNEKISIKSKDLQEKCRPGYQICNIYFKIESRNDSFLQINIEDQGSEQIYIEFLQDDENEEDDDDDDDDDDKKLLIIILSISIFAILIILAAIFFLFKKKNENLKKNITNVSFGDEIIDRDSLVKNQ